MGGESKTTGDMAIGFGSNKGVVQALSANGVINDVEPFAFSEIRNVFVDAFDAAIWIAIWPTPPAPPCTKTRWPAWTAALSTMPSQAVKNTRGIAAASRMVRFFGFNASSAIQKHLAVLIDADNAPAAIVEGLFEEIAKYGVASVKRIYGDWTGPQLGGWKKVLLDHSIQPIQPIQPIQQFAYTKGKNATDSSLIIDAMDLLYTRRFNGFCLVSSDSDFTRLASRLREEGLTVYGFGEEKTPKPFVAACDKFIYIELLRDEAALAPTTETSAESSVTPDTTKPVSVEQPKKPKAPIGFITKILDDIADEEGWAHLSVLGTNISKLRPEFDPRTHGFKKLSDLIKAYPQTFELQARGASAGGTAMYARHRPPSK